MKFFIKIIYLHCKLLLNKIKYMRKKTIIKTIYVGKNTFFGKYCQINKNTHVGNNVKIGNFSYTNSGNTHSVVIENNVKIGSFCSIGPGVFIAPGNHDMTLATTHPILYSKKYFKKIGLNKHYLQRTHLCDEFAETVIGDDVWIGLNSIIKRGVKIGNGVVIGSGSVVTRDIPDYAIVGGCPARIIRYRIPDDMRKKILEIGLSIGDLSEEELKDGFSNLYDFNDYIQFIQQVKNNLKR